MGKSKRSDKEFTREQKLAQENKQLKQELGHLRKQISRLDASRIETIKEMCVDYEESKRFNENVGEMGSSLERLKKEWACKKCPDGFLEINLYPKLGVTWYYRSCSSCGKNNRTLGQRYDEKSVKGIMAKTGK